MEQCSGPSACCPCLWQSSLVDRNQQPQQPGAGYHASVALVSTQPEHNNSYNFESLLLMKTDLCFSFLWIFWRKEEALGDWLSQLLDRLLQGLLVFFITGWNEKERCRYLIYNNSYPWLSHRCSDASVCSGLSNLSDLYPSSRSYTRYTCCQFSPLPPWWIWSGWTPGGCWLSWPSSWGRPPGRQGQQVSCWGWWRHSRMTRIPPSWVETEEEGGQGPALTLHSRTSESWIYIEFILNRFQRSSLNSHTFTQ